MCDPIVGPILTVATMGMQIAQGYAENSGLKQEAANARLQGNMAYNAANAGSNQIRAQGGRELGKARVTQAAYGGDLSGGSGADVGGHMAGNVEHEALMHLYGGRQEQWQQNYRSQILKHQGKQAVLGGYMKAGQTLLGSAISGGFFDSPAASQTVKIGTRAPLEKVAITPMKTLPW